MSCTLDDAECDRERNTAASKLIAGDIILIVDGYEVYAAGRRQSLTLAEYRLLYHLLRQPGRTLTMDQLARLDGDLNDPPTDRALRARVAAIRRKLGSAADQIKNVRGVGYRIDDH